MALKRDIAKFHVEGALAWGKSQSILQTSQRYAMMMRIACVQIYHRLVDTTAVKNR